MKYHRIEVEYRQEAAKKAKEMATAQHVSAAAGAATVGTSSSQPTMRRAIEASFSKCLHKPFYGRLLSTSQQPMWLTYGQVAARIRPLGLIFDVLTAEAEVSGTSGVAGRRRPFAAIAGPNALEWLVCDWACSGLFIPNVGELQ